MTKKSIIIIGAGVAGLCTGIYGQMNGYQTRIIEKHKIPGGLVTAWRRKGFLIDLCVHWLAGSGSGIHLHRYWNEVGLLEGRKFLQHDRYGVYHARDGRTVNFYCDPDRLEQHLLELSPEDAAVIHELAEGVRFGIRFNPPEMERYEAGALRWMKVMFSMMPHMKDLQKWSKVTVGELAERFHSPLLREALLTVWEPDFSVFFMILTSLGFMYKQQGGYPLGGSLPLALALEKRYKQLGGQVQYQSRVEKILVENGRAVGVRFDDGSEQRADVVVSAADGYTTIFKLLEGKFTDKKIRERYENWKPFQSMIYVSVGVRRTFPDIPLAVEGNAFELKKPVLIAGEEHKKIGVRVHNEEPGFAPVGKTVLTSAIFTNHEHWKSLQGDRGAYEAEKENVARAYIDALEQIWPGISAEVEMYDVATPLTFERITGNWKASITGWKLTPEQGMASISRTLPGLDNFWMAGHWVYPGGGLPAGVSTGREVIWRQCEKDKRKFAAA
ncbi:MAG: NAD(P)/FAD-dependent oxidoreductase [Chloroflexota bacterium]|nr:MAG: NAD(P)/FAD-dependent oxidoreductase [Chloroflexota bacterium]